jgi:hypothetical protein
MLRVKGDEVQTSMGAVFPVSHALKALPIVLRVMESGQTWERNGKTIHLGHYQIDKIQDGKLYAGCHVIDREEIEHFAELVKSSTLDTTKAQGE